MPTYELALMLRVMSRVSSRCNWNKSKDIGNFDFFTCQPDLIGTVTRTSQAIFSKGGFLRKIDNIGEQQLPFKINKNSQKHLVGNAWSNICIILKLYLFNCIIMSFSYNFWCASKVYFWFERGIFTWCWHP